MRPLGDEGDACQSKKYALASDGSRRESPRRALATVHTRMFIGVFTLGGGVWRKRYY